MNNLHASERATAGLLRANIAGKGVGGGMRELEGERRKRKGEGTREQGHLFWDSGKESCPKCRDGRSPVGLVYYAPSSLQCRKPHLGFILTWGKFLPM